MNNLLSLKFLSKKLPKSFSISHSNSHYFCRTFHSLCKPNNKNSHFLSPIHQWRSSSSSSLTNSGFLLSNHAISRYYVSSAHFKKSFLGCGFRFLTNCSKFKFLPTQKKSSLGLGWIKWLQRQVNSSDRVLFCLIFANAAVFTMWQVLPQDFMYRHFTLSWDNIRSGRIYTVLTSAFSHFDTIHFGKNMIGLLFFGGFIGKLNASEALILNLYLLGAIGGSLFYLLPQVNKNQEISGMDPLLGANGPVNSFVFIVMLLFPKRVWFQILIPVPARAAPIPVTVTATILGTIIVGMDLLSILQGDPHGTSAQLLAAAIATAAYII